MKLLLDEMWPPETAAQLRRRGGLILTSNQRFPRHDPRTAGRLVTSLDELLSAGMEAANLEHWLS